MLTVLHFVLDGDTSGYFPQLARWHDRTRFRMLFATLGPADPQLATQLRHHCVPCVEIGCNRRRHYAAGLLRLARLLRRERVDVLHAHLFDPGIVGLLAGTLVRTPVRVLTRHYSDCHSRLARPWHVRLDRLCTFLAHAVIAVSQHTADYMTAYEGAAPAKLHVIHNGIDLDRVRPSAPDARGRIRRELRLGDADVLLTVGRLHPEKGQSYLFRALPGLRRRAPRPFVLLLAGAGQCEAQYREELAGLRCQDIVRFLGFRHDVPDLIAGADVVVQPSVAEAFGLAVAEALYLGTPVVAARVGGIPEIVTDGVDGVLVPPCDPRAIEDALAGLLNDPHSRQRLLGAGTTKVSRCFRFEDMVRAYEDLYDRLAAGHVS